MSGSASAGEASARPLCLLLLAASGVALATRLYAARVVGFGDSESLYASYALFPAPAYVDHPGLIGLIARDIGHGSAPTTLAAHTVTAVAATLAPWWMVACARMLGASARSALLAGLLTLAAPEVAVGLFGMTPDLPLFFAWVMALGCFGRALTRAPGSLDAALLFTASGVALGVGCAAKVSGLTLALACLLSLSTPRGREHARTAGPWTTLFLAACIFAPVVAHEQHTGWPMVHHRLVDTQHDAGLSIRNAFAIVMGQAAYVSPLLFVGGLVAGRQLYRSRREDSVTSLLAAAVFVPVGVLGALCLWSRVAEPHWLAPAWLALPLYLSLRRNASAIPTTLRFRAFGTWAIGTGVAISVAIHAWGLMPGWVSLVPLRFYDARLDIANELYGWPEVRKDVMTLVAETRGPEDAPGDVVVAGGVWMECAQLRAALPADVVVGCVGEDTADFAGWAPQRRWSKSARVVIFVHDNRAPKDSAALFPDRARLASVTRPILRGSKVARLFTLEVLPRLSVATRGPALQVDATAGAMGDRPASRMSAMSSASSGFGVVSSRSP